MRFVISVIDRKKIPLMKTPNQNPQTTSLKALGFRRRKQEPIKPDVDYPNHDERVPQAPNFTGMWLDHWSHWGDVKNPVGTPMESGA